LSTKFMVRIGAAAIPCLERPPVLHAQSIIENRVGTAATLHCILSHVLARQCCVGFSSQRAIADT
jgi:hypothetical protein